MTKPVRLGALPILLLSLLSACAGARKAPDLPPEELFRQAKAAVQKSNFEEAETLLDRLRDEYPFSRHAVEAELLAADSAFKQKKYEEAAAAYKSFEELHPTHLQVPYAIYRRGLSYAEMAVREDRDQTATRNAAEAFQKLLNAYPQSEHAEEAGKRLAQARATLAAHEFYVAQYYVRRGKYDAALSRLQIVVEGYPELPIREKAQALAAELQAKKKGGPGGKR
jgi:outer membrane protein assembly factor BamD